MRKVQNMVKRDRIRLLEFFQDHDPLRKGTVTDQKFKGVLHAQGIRLTDAEFALLDNKYSFRSNMTNYKQFCDDLDNIFTDKNLEKDPLKKPQ